MREVAIILLHFIFRDGSVNLFAIFIKAFRVSIIDFFPTMTPFWDETPSFMGYSCTWMGTERASHHTTPSPSLSTVADRSEASQGIRQSVNRAAQSNRGEWSRLTPLLR